MHMIITIYFTYVSGTVRRDRHKPKNERKSSRGGHFIIFVLQKIVEIPALAPNICIFLHITSHRISIWKCSIPHSHDYYFADRRQ